MPPSLETVSCDLCGSTRLAVVWSAPDRLLRSGAIFNVVRCNRCELVFVNPRPAAGDIVHYYPTDYLSFLPSKGVSRLFRRFAAGREVKEIRRLCGKTPSILEVGAGSGEDLALLRKALGAEVKGTEVSPDAVRAAKDLYGVDLRLGELPLLRLPSASFDYVRVKYVLSHVLSPRELLGEVHRVLSHSGVVKLWVPNFNSWSRAVFGSFWQGGEPPRHLFDFTERTLARYLSLTGFEIISCRQSVVPNTWIHSVRVWLLEHGCPRFLAKLFSVNPLTALLFLPVSVAVRLFGKSDRLIVLARRAALKKT